MIKAITPILMNMSEILKTGKFTKFNWKKSLTYPKTILSCKFPAIPADKSAMKKQVFNEIDFK